MATNSGEGTGGGRLLNGRYQLLGLVGGGGMAQVYKARDNILGRTVAIKVLREQYAGDTQFVARFRREAQAAANLAHPNIVNVYDVGQEGDVYYIVMEYIAGDNLKVFIRRSAPFATDKALSIAIQILAGIEYAHRSGLIHRDIKPQNVLMTPEGGVKVTDFGIAKSVSDLGLTEAGTALGTAHYFSPEQARGERVLPQSDIYALGVTLYEMLTGHIPFESDNIMGLAFKHISEPPRPPRLLNPSIPARLEAIVLKALAKEPTERFSSAAEMEKALRSVQAGGRDATMEVPVAHSSVSQGSRGVPRATARNGGAAGAGGRTGAGVGAGAGTPTNALRGNGNGGGTPTSVVYPSAARGGGGAAASMAPRSVANTLGAPTSMASRPARSQVAGSGCSGVGVALFMLGLLAVIGVSAWVLVPQVSNWLDTSGVVPSNTPTATVPTSTPTPTKVPPTHTPTPTSTSTSTPTATPQSAPVPQLVGLKLADAKILAKQRGFELVELEQVISTEQPEGTVAQQDPAPNVSLKQTSRISVRVSSGPPIFKLPPVANTDLEVARATLEGAGLKVQLTYEGSDTVPKGVVLRTEPPPDADVRAGDTIRVVVSRGDVVQVPNLIGVENLDVATTVLERAGLQVGVVTEIDDTSGSIPPGAVFNHDPPRGTVVERGTLINIQLTKRE